MYWGLILLFAIYIIRSYSDDISGGCGCGNSNIFTRPKITAEIKLNPEIRVISNATSEVSYSNVGFEPFFFVDDEEIENNEKQIMDMVLIPEGIYQVGTDDVILKADKEGPKRMVKVKSFYMDKFEVSNEDFDIFVHETNYVTDAEKKGFGSVFNLFLNSTVREAKKDQRSLVAPWWYAINGTQWRHPHGPGSNITGELMSHPVTQVSWNDAVAYCAWRGARLPTEAEWEGACRGGHYDTLYPWGNKLLPEGRHMANLWQGTFPTQNTEKDGYFGTCPIVAFGPNEFGLANMIGNVWEWTADSWSEDKAEPEEKVTKGGSFMCHYSYCTRYRCSARTKSTPDTAKVNLGFRCAKSLD